MTYKLLATALLASVSMQAAAAILVADTGWQDDGIDEAGVPSNNSPWTFTVTQNSILSVTDDFITGDTYTLVGDVVGVTTFFAGNAGDIQATGTYGLAWLDSAYSKIAVSVGAGTYTFSISGDGVGGVPAGFGVRLDSVIPEPATWGMMILGFGLVGATMRRRTAVAA